MGSPSIKCSLQTTFKVSFPEWLAGDGAVYVAHENSIDRFAAEDGVHSKDFISAKKPMGMAVTGGLLYVSERGMQRVSVFNSKGQPVAHWGGLGSGIGQFNNPAGLTLQPTGNHWKGRVYVADEGNHRIQVFTDDGGPVTQWGGFGKGGHGTFDRPYGIAVGSDLRVYVADAGTGLVQVFGPDGKWVDQWDATAGTGLSTAAYVNTINGKNGLFVFVSDGKGPVAVYNQDHIFQGLLALPKDKPRYPAGMTGSGDFYMADPLNGEITLVHLTDDLFKPGNK